MSSSRKASTARSKSRASRRDPDDVAEAPTAAAEPAPTAAAATSAVVAAPAPANPFGVDPEASVTVVDTNGNHNDPDDDLTQTELAAKYKIELTGDPFIDSDRLQEAKAALAPAPKAKRHRAEGTAAPRRGKHKEDEANTVTRLKTITATEKKGVTALRQVIGLLAREIALRTNRVPQLVADITAVLNHVAEAVSAATLTQGGQADDSTAGQDGDATMATAEPVTFIPLPPCDVPALLSTVIEAARKSAEAWAADPDGQIELDDELLRTIAHAAAKALNAIEGFVAPPDLVVSEKGRAARLKLIAAAKERELKLQGKLAEKERVELEKQRQRQREEMQAKAVKGLGVEDADLDHPSPIVGVACAPVPLLSVELFEAALRVWSVVTSAPKMTKVTQMPFTTFIMGLKDNASGGTIMRDVVRGLVEAAGGGDIADSRASVKSWLGPCLVFMTDRMDAIVAAAAAEVSRAKVKPKPKAPKKVAGTGGRGIRRHHASSSEDDSDDDGESDDDDDDDDDDEEEESDPDALDDTADAELDDDGDEVKDAPEDEGDEDEGDEVKDETKEGGEAVIRKLRPETPMQAARRQAEERLAHVRALVEQYSPTRMCSWVQLTVAERLRLLTFLTEVLLQSDGFVAHMASVEERCRIEQNKFDARVKQIRDDAEKAKKVLRQQQRDADPKTHKKDKNATGSPLPEAAPEEAAAPPPPPTKGSKKGAAASPASPAPPKLLTEAEYAAKRTQIDEKAEKAVEQAYAAFRAKLDKEDFGTRIKPLGRDRYKRLVWYFPQDRRLLVQHVPGSTEAFTDAANGRSPTSGMLPPIVTRVAEWGTPALAPPVATKSLIDDEVVDFRRTRGAMRDSAPVEQPQDTEEELGILLGGGADHKAQTTWAFVAASDLRAYVESLDERGLREGPLRAAVKLLIPHITAVDMAVEAVRASRRTNVNFGYFNQLREKSWGW